MSWLAALLLAQAPPAAADYPDIVVVAERMNALTVRVGQGPDGKWYCGMDGSSGVLSLDKKLCRAVTKCVRKGASTDAEVEACIAGSKRRLLARFEREMKARR